MTTSDMIAEIQVAFEKLFVSTENDEWMINLADSILS
jgi:hypothetical protein